MTWISPRQVDHPAQRPLMMTDAQIFKCIRGKTEIEIRAFVKEDGRTIQLKLDMLLLFIKNEIHLTLKRV